MAYSSGLEQMIRSAVSAALATDEVQAALADEGLTAADVDAVEVSHPSFGEDVVDL